MAMSRSASAAPLPRPSDARDVRPPHVGDVFVLVAYFLDREADDFQPHLAHVVGAGGAHAVADHFRLLDDLLDGELADDAAQVDLPSQAESGLRAALAAW